MFLIVNLALYITKMNTFKQKERQKKESLSTGKKCLTKKNTKKVPEKQRPEDKVVCVCM